MKNSIHSWVQALKDTLGFSKADESHHYTDDGTDSQNNH